MYVDQIHIPRIQDSEFFMASSLFFRYIMSFSCRIVSAVLTVPRTLTGLLQYITAKQTELHSTWELFGEAKWLWAEWMLPRGHKISEWSLLRDITKGRDCILSQRLQQEAKQLQNTFSAKKTRSGIVWSNLSIFLPLKLVWKCYNDDHVMCQIHLLSLL